MGVIHNMEDKLVSLNKTTAMVTSTAHTNQAKEWSESLMHIVDNAKDSNGKPVMYQYLSGTKFLKVEAWELIGKYAGVSAETEEIWELRNKQGNISGYRAKVVLVDKDTGQRVGGGAIMQSTIDENVAKGQYTQGGKESACLSMAQTRATSKAFRMNYSYIAVLGGYSSLPSEELTDEMQAGVSDVSDLVNHAVEQGAQIIESTPKTIFTEQFGTLEVQPQVNNCAIMECVQEGAYEHEGILYCFSHVPAPDESPSQESAYEVPAQPAITIDDSAFTCPLHTGNEHTKKTNKSGGVFWSHPWAENKGGWCAANEWNELFPKDEIAGAWAAKAESAKGPQASSYLYETCTGQPIATWLSAMTEILA